MSVFSPALRESQLMWHLAQNITLPASTLAIAWEGRVVVQRASANIMLLRSTNDSPTKVMERSGSRASVVATNENTPSACSTQDQQHEDGQRASNSNQFLQSEVSHWRKVAERALRRVEDVEILNNILEQERNEAASHIQKLTEQLLAFQESLADANERNEELSLLCRQQELRWERRKQFGMVPATPTLPLQRPTTVEAGTMTTETLEVAPTVELPVVPISGLSKSSKKSRKRTRSVPAPSEEIRETLELQVSADLLQGSKSRTTNANKKHVRPRVKVGIVGELGKNFNSPLSQIMPVKAAMTSNTPNTNKRSISASSGAFSDMPTVTNSEDCGKTMSLSAEPATPPKRPVYKVRIPEEYRHLYQLQSKYSSHDPNRYIESALLHTLNFAFAKLGDALAERLAPGLDITIVGHNDFYSQREQLQSKSLPLTLSSLSSLPPFCSTLSTISKVKKTGLGSSAAMITSLVGSLLGFLQVVQLPNTKSTQPDTHKDLRLVHNVAQFAHCLAQGKVGSGFDVSAAVYGSHIYRRFSPEVIDKALTEAGDPLNNEVGLSREELECVIDPNDGQPSWDNEISPFELPPGLTLMLADINAGSSTPKLVSKVLSWRKSKPEEAKALWEKLNTKNQAIASCLNHLKSLSVTNPHEYQDALEQCATTKPSEWSADSGPLKTLIDLRNTFSVLCTVFPQPHQQH
ncbi:phosphomevalonate kinase [Chytridiales sp. JEL 0842]|nr:phosphomevalonate kinase [Chytridiales sp. JEL 0842]